MDNRNDTSSWKQDSRSYGERLRNVLPKSGAGQVGNRWLDAIGANTPDANANAVLMAQDILQRARKDYAFPRLPPAPSGLPDLDGAVVLGKKMDESRGARGAPSAFDLKNWGRVKVWVYAVELREYDAASRLRILLWAWALFDRANASMVPHLRDQQLALAMFVYEQYGLRVGERLPIYFDDHYALLRLHCVRFDHCAFEYRFGRKKPLPKTADPGPDEAPPPDDDDAPGW